MNDLEILLQRWKIIYILGSLTIYLDVILIIWLWLHGFTIWTYIILGMAIVSFLGVGYRANRLEERMDEKIR